jgi:hypothetical protein
MRISVGSTHIIAADEEHYRKVCARWIPRRWTPEIKERWRDVCSVLLAQYEQDVWLREMYRTYTSSHCTTSSLVQNGGIVITPRAKKVRSQVSAERYFVFWDRKGAILEYYLEPRQTAVKCAVMLRYRLKPVVLRKHRDLLSPGVSVACQRPTTHHTREQIQGLMI